MNKSRHEVRGNRFPVTHAYQYSSGYPLEERIRYKGDIQFSVTQPCQAHPRQYGLEERIRNERGTQFPVTQPCQAEVKEHIRYKRGMQFPVTREIQDDYYPSMPRNSRALDASSPFLPDLTWINPGGISAQSNFDTWRPSPTAHLEVKYALGSGQVAAPFSVTRAL